MSKNHKHCRRLRLFKNKTNFALFVIQKLQGEFCHACGQQATGNKTTSRDVIQAILSGFLSIERGVWGVIQTLTIDPQMVVKNYWHGNRFYYYSPGQMIFYMIFVLALTHWLCE